MLLTKSIKLVMLISVQGSLGGGAALGAGAPRDQEFPSGPAAAPRRAGGTGQKVPAGPGRRYRQGRAGPGRAGGGGRRSGGADCGPQGAPALPLGRATDAVPPPPGETEAGGGCGLPPEPLSPAGQPGPGRCLGLCLPVQVFTSAGRTPLPRHHHPFPRHCQFRLPTKEF